MAAMNRHNRSLAFIFLFILVILGIILYQSRNYLMGTLAYEKSIVEPQKTISQEQMGIKEAQLPFLEILKGMSACLQYEANIPNDLTANIESILLVLQPVYGPQTLKDKSMQWDLRGKDGSEKKLHLNLISDDEGKMIKQLEVYSVDIRGTEVKLELDPEKTKNPTDEYINTFLKDVEVLQKLKTSTAEFTNGVVLTYQEHENEIVNFEITKDQNTFHCQSLKSADNCQCLH